MGAMRPSVDRPPGLRDGAVDLLLGGTCLGCERPGRLLCTGCAAGLPTTAVPCWPSPAPPGLVTPFAVGPYDGLLRAMVVGHKERRLLALTRVLGALLACSVRAAVAAAEGPVLLVPTPSRPTSVRSRGHDPMAAMTRAAATTLGAGVGVVPLLRTRRGLVDQAGLDSAQRHTNLAGSMRVHPRRLDALARRGQAVHVVLCDDVLTTGSTAREGQRALEAVGLRPLAVAVVAATRRRSPPRNLHGVSSGPAVPPRVTNH